MKSRRRALRILLSFCLLVDASIAAESGIVPESVLPKSPIEICKLIKYPSEFAGRTILLKAVLVQNYTPRVDGGDSYLYGPACRKVPFTVVVEFDSQESYQPLKVLSREPDRDGDVRLNVILVGVFHYSGTEKYGHLNWADSRFVVHRVEKATPTPAKTLWRG